MKKIAVVLFNLGGPDSIEAVQPFLLNLFNDPAILNVPKPLRSFIATCITKKRAAMAEAIYAQMGGYSPILPSTMQQQHALEEHLANIPNSENSYKVFISMRYWYPFSDEIVNKVKLYGPDEVILLPLYPQFSTTTTASSFKNWKEEAVKQQFNVKTKAICCYHNNTHFITAHLNAIEPCYAEATKAGEPRIIFSAHGLPQKVIDAGDPYQWQVEQTVAFIVAAFTLKTKQPDWVISYQSKVGPLKWIGPSTEEEIIRAGKDNVPVVVVPIAFVSEHSETLVELDIEYRELAQKHAIPAYIRVPALGIEPLFIEALSSLCQTVANWDSEGDYTIFSGNENNNCNHCPGKFGKCAAQRK